MLTYTNNSTLKLVKQILFQMSLHTIYPNVTLFWLISSFLKIMNIAALVGFVYM